MKRSACTLFLGIVVVLLPLCLAAQMMPVAGSGGMMNGGSTFTAPGSSSGMAGAMPTIWPMYGPSVVVVGDDGAAYMLLDVDYSDPKAVKSAVAAFPLPGAGSNWKTSVNGAASLLVAGTNAVVVGVPAPAVMVMGLVIANPGTPVTSVTDSLSAVAPPKSTVHFLKPASGAVLRDPLELEGSLLSVTMKKVGSNEYVYVLTRSIALVSGVITTDPTRPIATLPSPKVRLTVISLTQNWVRTVDVATGQAVP